MRILLVRPRRRKKAITLGEFMFSEPLGLECLATLFKDKHQLKILDLMAGNEDFIEVCQDWQPDIVGFTSLCVDVNAVIELAGKIKKNRPDMVTLVGGTQTFLAPDYFFSPNIDHVIKYTTRKNVTKLLSYIENNLKVPLIDGIYSKENNFQSTDIPGINEYIVPDRKFTQKYRHQYNYFGYQPCALLQTSQGCSSHCNFCLRWKIEGGQEKEQPLEEIIAQIKEIEEPNIMIIDNNFLCNKERLDKFCALLEAEGIKKNFICYASVDSIITNQRELARFKNNGLQVCLVGYESFSDAELKKYNKKATIQDNIKASQILKKLNIDCWASFILHPDWNDSDFQQFRKYIKKLAPEISSLTPLTALHGSSLYQKYQDRVMFAKEDYDLWSFSLVSIKPKFMSLRKYYYQVLKTNIFVNLFLNNTNYMIKRFGFSTVFRVLKGSVKFLFTYLKLMVKG